MATRTESLPIEQLLTVQDVAEILQVSRATIYQLVKDDKLKPVDLGLRKTRFQRSDVLEFIGGHE